MTTNACTALLLAAMAVATPSATGQPATKPSPIATLVLSAPSGPVKPGAVVLLKILLTNISSDEISVDLAEQCEIDIRDEKGNLAGETDSGAFHNHRLNPDGSRRWPKSIALNSPTINGQIIFRTFKPGETWLYGQDIAHRYKPLPPGKYTVQARALAYVPSTTTPNGPTISNVVTLIVEP